jgi:hypothetical protein
VLGKVGAGIATLYELNHQLSGSLEECTQVSRETYTSTVIHDQGDRHVGEALNLGRDRKIHLRMGFSCCFEMVGLRGGGTVGRYALLSDCVTVESIWYICK